jgi:protein-disulfide isomerase
VINLALFALALFDLRRAQERVGAAFARDCYALLNRPRKLLLVGAAGALALLSLQLAITPYWQAAGWSDLPELPQGEDEDGHHWIGAEEPRVTVVEFSDYECPHCRKAHKDARLLAAEFPGEVRVVHRHLPLDRGCHPGLSREFHRHACRFAIAAECAGEQQRFWEMNDALFAIQDTVRSTDVSVVELAVRLGLDRSRFQECMDTSRGRKRVARDLDAALARRLNSTPTFLIGNKRWIGRLPRSALDQALRTAVSGTHASR